MKKKDKRKKEKEELCETQWIADEKVMLDAKCECMMKRGDLCNCNSYPWMDDENLVINSFLKYKRQPLQGEQFYIRNGYNFCVIDMDYKMYKREPVVRLFGVTEEGNSVMCQVFGFYPYFFVELSREINVDEKELAIDIMQKALNRNSVYPNNVKMEKVGPYWSTDGYRREPIANLYKIELKVPRGIRKLRTIIKQEDIFHSLNFDVINDYESNVEFILRFCIDKKLPGCSYVHVDHKDTSYNQFERHSNCQIEFRTNTDSLKIHNPNLEETDSRWKAIPNYRILSFDIECRKRGDKFPNSKYDPVFQICVELYEVGTKIYQSVGLTLGTCLDVKGKHVMRFKTESALILAWQELIIAFDPDIITGYNIDRFDIPYVTTRAENIGIDKRYNLYSRVLRMPGGAKYYVKLIEKTDGSKQISAKIKTFRHLCTGRVTMDMFKVMRKNYKLPSYKLNYVAGELLGMMKDDIHHSAISPLCDSNAKGRWLLLKYCIKDALLPALLMINRQEYVNSVMMSRITNTPLSYIIDRGQTVKVKCQYLKKCRERGFVQLTRDVDRNAVHEKFKGAWVADPIPGLYSSSEDYYQTKLVQKTIGNVKDPTDLSSLKNKNNPVVVDDFASLYPSIMIAYNICYTTKISFAKVRELEAAGVGEGIGYYKIPTNPARYFVTPKIRKGVIPEMLEHLLKERKKEKILMKAANKRGDLTEAAIKNGTQMALKTSANSIYGFTGSIAYRDIDVCESVTGVGRHVILLSKKVMEEHFTVKNGYPRDAKVIYGDSVTGDTPILMRYNGRIFIEQIKNIIDMDGNFSWNYFHVLTGNNWMKEQILLNGTLEVWSSYCWLPVKRVIRHKSQKKVYRVNTHCGCVDVTEDHSLLTQNQEKIKPLNCRVGETKLLHSLPKFNMVENQKDTNLQRKMDLAWCYGLFFADGSTGVVGINSNSGNWWKISKQDKSLLQKAQKKLEGLFQDFDFYIVDHLKSSKVYNLLAKRKQNIYGQKVKFVRRFRNKLYDGKYKKVPNEILNETNKLVLKSFFNGYYSGDGDKGINYYQFSCKGKIGSMGLFFVCHKLGFNVSVNTRTDKMDIYRMTISKKFGKNPTIVKKIYDVSKLHNQDDYVYDIETIIPLSLKHLKNSSQFHGGVGSLILKNTDSVMVILAENLEDSYKIGKEAAKLVTETINKPPISLEFEKIYCPYILFSRKKYIGLLYERPDGKPKYDAKGVANKRRDTCLLVKRLLIRLANIYMNKEDVPKEFEGTKTDYAISICRNEYRRTLEGNVRFEELILSKGMSKPEDEYAKDNRVPAHISLVRRIKRRRPGTEPQAGDRVFYVLVDKGHKSYVHKMSARPEDVLEHNLPIAYWKYAELLKKEVCRFFASILSGGYGKIDYENWNEKRRKDEINKIIKKNIGIAEKIIFGNLRVKVKKPTYGVGAIEKFLVRIPKCLKCKTKLVVPSKKRRKVKKSRKGKKQDVEEDCLCEECVPEKHKMLSEYLHKRRLLIQKADAIEKQCLACQEETYGLVKCGNNECKYFYLKYEIQLDIEDIGKNLGCLMTSYKNGEIKKCNGLIQKLKIASRCSK